MTTWLTRTTIALLLMSVTPATASAQFWDIVKWLNDMSGPQMIGTVVEVPVWCRYESDATKFLKCPPTDRLNKDDRRHFTIGPRFGWAHNTHALGNEPTVRETTIRMYGVAARWSPHLAPMLDLTASVETVQFKGPTVDDFSSPTVDGGIVIRPIGLFKPLTPRTHALTVSWRYKKFFDEFGGERFGAPGTFRSKNEGISQITIGLDLSAFLFK